MGFGTLFFGYFLLLDIAYYLITDVIAAAIMAYALSKLSTVNRGFKAALIASLVFLVFSAAEFAYGAYEMLFTPPNNPALISYSAALRNVIISILTFTALEGMRDVSAEVGLELLSKKCKIAAYATLPVYLIAIIAETPALLSFTTTYVAAIIGVSSILITLILIIVNLTIIHSCYCGICMPEENEQQSSSKKKKKESFLDSYKRQRDERKEALFERTSNGKKTDNKRN